MIRPSTRGARALKIINQAAAYQGVIPEDCWQEPYMPLEELLAEMAAGVNSGAASRRGPGRGHGAAGGPGRHPHPPCLRGPRRSSAGIGARLLSHLRQGVSSPLLVGTWAAAWWAVRFYQKHGFRLVTPEEKDRLLRVYWTISDRQVETSVVLADEKWFRQPAAPAD